MGSEWETTFPQCGDIVTTTRANMNEESTKTKTQQRSETQHVDHVSQQENHNSTSTTANGPNILLIPNQFSKFSRNENNYSLAQHRQQLQQQPNSTFQQQQHNANSNKNMFFSGSPPGATNSIRNKSPLLQQAYHLNNLQPRHNTPTQQLPFRQIENINVNNCIDSTTANTTNKFVNVNSTKFPMGVATTIATNKLTPQKKPIFQKRSLQQEPVMNFEVDQSDNQGFLSTNNNKNYIQEGGVMIADISEEQSAREHAKLGSNSGSSHRRQKEQKNTNSKFLSSTTSYRGRCGSLKEGVVVGSDDAKRSATKLRLSAENLVRLNSDYAKNIEGEQHLRQHAYNKKEQEEDEQDHEKSGRICSEQEPQKNEADICFATADMTDISKSCGNNITTDVVPTNRCGAQKPAQSDATSTQAVVARSRSPLLTTFGRDSTPPAVTTKHPRMIQCRSLEHFPNIITADESSRGFTTQQNEQTSCSSTANYYSAVNATFKLQNPIITTSTHYSLMQPANTNNNLSFVATSNFLSRPTKPVMERRISVGKQRQNIKNSCSTVAVNCLKHAPRFAFQNLVQPINFATNPNRFQSIRQQHQQQPKLLLSPPVCSIIRTSPTKLLNHTNVANRGYNTSRNETANSDNISSCMALSSYRVVYNYISIVISFP